MSTSIFVLSACSGAKAVDAVVDCQDIDEAERAALTDEHPSASMEAKSLYTGAEHQHIKAAIERLEEVATVDWRIISAGFGVVSPETVLPSYECTFKNDTAVRERVERRGMDPSTLTKAERIQTVATYLGIPTAIQDWLNNKPDILLIALGNDYLLATSSALSAIPKSTTALGFAPKGSRDLIGECLWIPSTETEREAHHTMWTKVKGCQLRSMANSISSADDLLEITAEEIRKLSLPAEGEE